MSSDQNQSKNIDKSKRYSTEIKLGVIEDLKSLGVTAVCKKHGVSSSQVYKWQSVSHTNVFFPLIFLA
jgi:transposase-like protein